MVEESSLPNIAQRSLLRELIALDVSCRIHNKLVQWNEYGLMKQYVDMFHDYDWTDDEIQEMIIDETTAWQETYHRARIGVFVKRFPSIQTLESKLTEFLMGSSAAAIRVTPGEATTYLDSEPIFLGRQCVRKDDVAMGLVETMSSRRFVVAPHTETIIARDHLLLCLDGMNLTIANISKGSEALVQNRILVTAGGRTTQKLPCNVQIGERIIEVAPQFGEFACH